MDTTDVIAREQSSLRLGRYGNLFMGCAGVLAAWLSGSQAVLVDGLFSLIGLAAAVFAARVGAAVDKRPDHRRPLGYAVDESIFTTFRALSLLGLVGFAAAAAFMNILDYAFGGAAQELNYTLLIAYFLVIIFVCFGLAISHFLAWRQTGRQSRVLLLEGRAAFFDGLISLAAGAGLAAMPFLEETAIGWITPVGDSVIVLGLCGLVITRYSRDFMKGLEELGGGSAPEKDLGPARELVTEIVGTRGGRLVDLSAVRFGRSLQVQLYLDPEGPITARSVDDLTRACDTALRARFGTATSVVLVSEHGRFLPPA